MAVCTGNLEIETRGKGTYGITGQVARFVETTGISNGTVTVFVQHTSASLVLMENADPSARHDLHEFFEQLVPEDGEGYTHTDEGPDDMTSHIRMTLTGSSEVIPIVNGRMVLGTWQGIFLFEHRRARHRRQIVLTVMGE
ncbi:MAG: secondary thiamine-phosphate synthase enzyme YjbQ [Verrucomicrobiota bacterium JB023]|nr:secondary thiamine-phosphate synthase enzyme YjbQ [Verrucomicrobiota bacterium JB023]